LLFATHRIKLNGFKLKHIYEYTERVRRACKWKKCVRM